MKTLAAWLLEFQTSQAHSPTEEYEAQNAADMAGRFQTWLEAQAS